MKITNQPGYKRRFYQALAVACGTFMIGGAVCSAALLSLDFGPPGQAVPGGFLSFNTSSTNYGAITVSVISGADGFGDRYIGGSSSLSPLYRDFLYNNGYTTPINVQIEGLLPNETYDLRLYSSDAAGGGFNPTMQFTPTTGSGAPGIVTFSDTAPPTTDYQDSTVVQWTTDGSGTLAFNTAITGPVYFYGARLNGLEIMPEPSTVLLLGMGGLLLWHRRGHPVQT